MFKVETHNNSKEYYDNLIINKNALYITSNTSIANMMKERCKVSHCDKWRIIDIDNFFKVVYSKWKNPINKIKLKTIIRQILFELEKTSNNYEERHEINFLVDNIEILLSDIVLILESGVNKINYKADSKKLHIINEVINNLIENEEYKKISNQLLNLKSFDNIGKRVKCFLEKKDYKLEKDELLIEKIYFYNINYIDIKRYMLINMLQMSGYDILFKIPHYNNFNRVNECWKMVYGNKSIFNCTSNYNKNVQKKIKFVDYIEGNEINSDDSNVVIKKYREVYDFKQDLLKNKKEGIGSLVVTFYKDSIKGCLVKDSDNILRHCYQSEIGMFLKNLYSCKPKKDDVEMDYGKYVEMITSGWVEVKERNGVILESYLLDNEEYFQGVKTLNEIIERIEKIKEIEEVSLIFDKNAKSRAHNSEIKYFLSNPFKVFGYANTTKYGIKASYILELTQKLKSILRTGSLENGYITVKDHFNKLKTAFQNSYIKKMYSNGSEIEKNILNKIYSLIDNPSYLGEIVFRDDIAELFNVCLAFNNDEEKENDFSVDQLEGIIYRDCLFDNKIKRKICLSDFSYSSYQKYIKKYDREERVLSKLEIENLILNNLDGRCKEIVRTGLELQKASENAFGKYINFLLANLFINFDGIVEVSYIQSIRKNDGPAILLRQLETIYGTGVDCNQKLDTSKFETEEDLYFYDENELKQHTKSLPEVSCLDLDFCCDKFLYSSIISEYPMYFSDFHTKLAFSILISMIKSITDSNGDEIKKYFLSLFPQWQQVEKINIMDSESARKLNEYKYYDGINYPKKMSGLYLLKTKNDSNFKIRNAYYAGNFDVKKYYNEFVKNYLDDNSYNSGLHCKMCPHCYICRKGDFVIDYK